MDAGNRNKELQGIAGKRLSGLDGCAEGGCHGFFVVSSRARAYTLVVMNSWQDRITVTPDVRSGKPCIKGTRITVYDVLEYLAGGMTEDQILSDFPSLVREDIRACLAFAADRERRLASSNA